MKYKLLAVSKSSKLSRINIGDYVQALASSQFLPHIDGFIDRDEELKEYDGERCKVIMNGWYMHNPENWPPSEKILPLFVAFHVNSDVKEKLLSPTSLEYLKKYQPIGCRDLNTMKLLTDKGVKAYFSGCMTLTLGMKYHSEEKGTTTYIVDPLYNGSLKGWNIIRAAYESLIHPLDIFKLCMTKGLYLYSGRNILNKYIKTALYYKEYKRIFGRETVMKAVYISQGNERQNKCKSDQEQLNEAEFLIKQYSKAQLVITSRIHCALPCLGIETPVIYLENGQDVENSFCRMGGLRELFNIIVVDKGVLVPKFDTTLPITANNHPKNKESWKLLAQGLMQRCKEFIKDIEL